MRYDCELNASWHSHNVLISSYKYTLWPGQCTGPRASWPTNCGLFFGRGNRFFSSPKRPDRIWGPLSPLLKGHWGLLSRGWSGRDFKVTTHLHLVPKVRMSKSYSSTPLYAFKACKKQVYFTSLHLQIHSFQVRYVRGSNYNHGSCCLH